jgi:tetratricopeptide (TPR) repeat protein
MDSTAKAIEYLSKFSTSSKGVQARAYKLLGDAYGDSGKNKEALDAYKKAARHFEKDEVNSPDYLFLAAYFADQVMQDSKEAIALYEEIREKYPRSQQSYDAEKYLARLGVYQSAN